MVPLPTVLLGVVLAPVCAVLLMLLASRAWSRYAFDPLAQDLTVAAGGVAGLALAVHLNAWWPLLCAVACFTVALARTTTRLLMVRETARLIRETMAGALPTAPLPTNDCSYCQPPSNQDDLR